MTHTVVRTLAVLTLLALNGVWAQEVQVCSDSDAVPTSGTYWLKCTKDDTSTDSITINGENIDIDATGNNVHGIHGTHAGSGDITVSITSGGTDTPQAISTIATSGAFASGIQAEHTGTGDITIDVSSNGMENPSESSITTTGLQGHGIAAIHGTFSDRGSGDIGIKLRDMASIDVGGDSARGIFARHFGMGNAGVTLESASTIKAQGTLADGIAVEHVGQGNITIDLSAGTTINASRTGIYLQHEGLAADAEEFSTSLTLEGTTITTATGYGIWNNCATTAQCDARTTVRENSSITTAGRSDYGIYSLRQGGAMVLGDVIIDVQDSAIRTESTATNDQGQTASFGILGVHQSIGDLDIDLAGGSITTAGNYSYGIYGLQQGAETSGDIDITTGRGHRITTTGTNGHGIVTYHFGTGTDTSRSMAATVGGTIAVSGAHSRGVQMGIVNADSGAPERVSNLDPDGFRHQTVTVNGPITSTGAGVYLAGGGRVIIGPAGRIDSDSRIVILATGTVPEVMDDPMTTDVDEAMPEIPPRLRVDLNPEGRRMMGESGWLAGALGGGWILNDGGETTIAVNDVVLHDGVTGATRRTAPNGAWDVRMRAQGVTVDRSTDPWTLSARASGIVADRDFSAEDFVELAGACPPGQVGTRPNCTTPPPPMCPAGQVGTPPNCTTPPPPMCPAGQVGTPPNCTTPPPPMCPAGQVGTPPNCVDPEPEPPPPVIMEEYAPRAALYEVLPDFLLGLQMTDLPGHHLISPELPVWIELLGSTKSQDFDRSTVDAEYDTEYLVATAGGTVLESAHWNINASAHHISGSADVSSPVKGGDIHVKGQGLSFDVHWRNEDDYFAAGHMVWTDYDLDISSDNIGKLISSVDAERLAVQVEAGRRLRWGEYGHWTPHVRLDHTRVQVDSFTDAVSAKVSFADTDRTIGSLGLKVDTTRSAGGGEGSLWASLLLEHAFGDAGTGTMVSGERLRAEPLKHRVHVTMGVSWQRGPWVLHTALSLSRADANNQAYASTVNLGIQF